jgi:hypothetical protein
MGGARLGGEVQSWTVTPEGISERVIYRFPDYEATLHAGAAVAQRIMRGDETVDVAAGLVPTGDIRRQVIRQTMRRRPVAPLRRLPVRLGQSGVDKSGRPGKASAELRERHGRRWNRPGRHPAAGN